MVNGRVAAGVWRDLDFNLPGYWYLRIGLFDGYDSKPPDRFVEERLRLVERFREAANDAFRLEPAEAPRRAFLPWQIAG